MRSWAAASQQSNPPAVRAVGRPTTVDSNYGRCARDPPLSRLAKCRRLVVRKRTVVGLNIVAVCAAFSGAVFAQSNPMVWAVAKHVEFAAFETNTYKYQCPGGSIPVSYSFVTRNPNQDSWLENDRSFIDRNGTKIARNAVTSLDQLDGGGLTISMYNINCHAQQFEASMSCMSMSTSTDNKLVMAKASSTAPRSSIGTAVAFCPADSPVAFGGFSAADGTMLQDVASAPAWGTSASPVFLADVADGTMGPP